jgi:transglutaminase-like putative cysteine protease
MNRHAPPQRPAHAPSPQTFCAARALAPLWAALLLLLACAGAAAKPSFTVQLPPAWVRAAPPPQAADEARAKDAESGLRFLLDDQQVRVGERGVQYYYHLVEQVSSAAAVEQVSRLQLDFEPSYQSLVIHHINVLRAGQTINALRPSEVKVIQREQELDKQLFNGTLSAVVFLNDVRPGDVLDYAYSVNGTNPVLAGDFADTFQLAESDPVDYLRARLLWPASRKLYVRARQTDAQPSVAQTGDEVEYVWERRDVPAAQSEDSTPSWFDPVPSVQLSEFETWADVARWAAPLYEVKGLSPALKAQIAEWQKLPDPEARLLAARRFVQDEVRYLGIEMGPYSHTPTQPSKVFDRRFGDCKDKSLLLSTILNALGIEARPALVNTDARHTLDEWQPSPYDFDHCIVRARLGDKTYWIDPTISYQRGTLDSYYPPEYERALVLRPDADSLDRIPLAPADQPTTAVLDDYRVRDFDSPVSYTVLTTLRGPDADAMRYKLAGESRADLGKEYLNFYADHEPSIQGDGLPEVSDDEQANVITITERYAIPRFWKEAAHEFLAQGLGADLQKPDVSRRATPLQVSYPANVEQLIEIHLPQRQEVATGRETVEDDALLFTAEVKTDNNVVRLRYTLRTKQEAVAPADVERHLASLDRARDLASYELKQGPPLGSASSLRGALDLLYWLALAGVALLVLFFWMKRRRAARLVAFAPARPRALPGAQPDTAIRLRAEGEIKHYLSDVPCRSCGRRSCGEAARQGLIYDEQRLVVVQLECERCRNSQDFYFAFAV